MTAVIYTETRRPVYCVIYRDLGETRGTWRLWTCTGLWVKGMDTSAVPGCSPVRVVACSETITAVAPSVPPTEGSKHINLEHAQWLCLSGSAIKRDDDAHCIGKSMMKTCNYVVSLWLSFTWRADDMCLVGDVGVLKGNTNVWQVTRNQSNDSSSTFYQITQSM